MWYWTGQRHVYSWVPHTKFFQYQRHFQSKQLYCSTVYEQTKSRTGFGNILVMLRDIHICQRKYEISETQPDERKLKQKEVDEIDAYRGELFSMFREQLRGNKPGSLRAVIHSRLKLMTQESIRMSASMWYPCFMSSKKLDLLSILTSV